MSIWKELAKPLHWFTPAPPPKPTEETPRPTEQEIMRDYPKTYQTSQVHGLNGGAAEIFDPSLQHFVRAFRVGDPLFEDSSLRQRWYATRREVIDKVLHFVANSRWHNHLVLRGSLLLESWSDAAREPGDIDWVFQPESVESNTLLADELFADLTDLFRREPLTAHALIDADAIALDDIWTYERASGRRIVFPWQADELPGGSVQMDVVFNEHLWDAPIITPISLSDGQQVKLWAASKEMSLIWKLLWLETDSYPQGKDLYDAVLLAEQTQAPLALLIKMLEDLGPYYRKNALKSDFPMEWLIDWDNFLLEYPGVAGTAQDWQRRLTEALRPAFEKLFRSSELARERREKHERDKKNN